MRRVSLLSLAVLVFTFGGASAAAEPGLVARWSSEKDPEEQEFDGGRFAALSTVPNLGNGPFTVSVWVNANDLKSGNPEYGRGVARSTRGELVGDWLISVHPDGRIRFCNWRKPGDQTDSGRLTVAPAVSTGKWHHLVAAWDGKVNRILVNGVEVKHAVCVPGAGWGVGHEVGRCWTEANYHWVGRIDDLRLYNRVLSADEIKRIHQAGAPTTQVKAFKPSGDPRVSASIDRILLDKLKRHNLQPAPPANDAEFCRRTMLDLAGRIPTPAELEDFLADKTADKRSRLIDGLLAGREMPMYWSQVLSGWLMPKVGRRDPKFTSYLRSGLAKNKSWDRFVREMLVARPEGPDDQYAVSFLTYRAAELKDNSIARDVGRAFFGVNLRCAQCHDHPHVAQWTREHFFGLSAFFVRSFQQEYVNAGNVKVIGFGEKPAGELEYTAPDHGKKSAPPMFLDGKALPTAMASSRRESLAKLAADPKSPYLKRAMVNRVWQRLMGRGLVEPVDMMYEGNPATHPELLDLLADDFAGHGFDLRRLMSTIAQSQAYARSSRWQGTDKLPEEALYAVGLLKPLDADQLAQSLPLATGYYDAQLKSVNSRTMSQVRSATSWPEVVAEFDAQGDEFEPTVGQALFLLNSNYAQTHFIAKSNLVQSLSTILDDAALARKAYVSLLSRLPSVQETARVSQYLSGRGTKSRAEACRELVWALLSGAEFRFNH